MRLKWRTQLMIDTVCFKQTGYKVLIIINVFNELSEFTRGENILLSTQNGFNSRGTERGDISSERGRLKTAL